jgi:hypothetical protein
MPPNRFRTGYVATAAEGAQLHFAIAGKSAFTLHYSPGPEAIRIATQRDSDFVRPAKPILLLKAEPKNDVVVIYPLNTTATSPDFLQRRYRSVRSFSLHGLSVPTAKKMDDIADFFNILPTGFVKDPYFGLGMKYELRLLVETIEKLGGVRDIRILKGKTVGLPKIDGTSYVISAKMFDEARRAIGRIHEKALEIAGDEKDAVLHNALLTPIDAARYPVTRRHYRSDGIIEALGDSLVRNRKLSRGDQSAVVSAAKEALNN